MKIDLVTIPKNGLNIDQELEISEELLKGSTIERLIKPVVKGKVYFNAADEAVLDATISGIMILLDAVDSSEIEYPFEVKILENLTDNDEYNLEKEQNTLDIMNILWQNIVLEVPMRVVKKENENTTLQGEGWELISEDTKKVDPRLAPLMDLLKEGKE